jgi:hypothetical protein
MVLSTVLGITNIVLKENQLSVLVKESEAAFHAADKGIECALFYHLAYDRNSPALLWSPFPTSTIGSGYTYPPNVNTATCNGLILREQTGWNVVSQTNNSATTEFHLDFGTPPNAACVDVQVANVGSGIDSTITAEGYNTCNQNSSRRTLRVIEVNTNL